MAVPSTDRRPPYAMLASKSRPVTCLQQTITLPAKMRIAQARRSALGAHAGMKYAEEENDTKFTDLVHNNLSETGRDRVFRAIPKAAPEGDRR